MRQEKSYVTYALLAIQIIVFIMMEVSGSSYDTVTLLRFGAKENHLIAIAGQYWRLITPLFVHIGFEHILFNSIALYFLGRSIEPAVGHGRFLLIYLASGFMGNLFSYQFSWAVSAGASTGLFGLFAYYLAMRFLYPDSPYYQAMGGQYQLLIIINLIANLFAGNVDIAGHLGGILGGFLVTVFLFSRPGTGRKSRIIAAAVYIAIAVFILVNHGAFNTLFA